MQDNKNKSAKRNAMWELLKWKTEQDNKAGLKLWVLSVSLLIMLIATNCAWLFAWYL